jgi:anthranilate/para-aminobenzoate synthase component I
VLCIGEDQTLITWGSGRVIGTGDDWQSDIRQTADAASQPWSQGWLGWLSYEAGGQFEEMPETAHSAAETPGVAFFRHQGALIHHGRTQTWTVYGDTDFKAQARALLEQATTRTLQSTPALSTETILTTPAQEIRFKRMVEEALEAIGRGEVYQVNLSWRVGPTPAPDPAASFLLLRQINPSTRGSLVRIGAWTLLSNSPELFLDLQPQGRALCARSLPIKGTAVAHQPGARRTLQESPKERAELTMITDLVRNDLGRVAVPGSVQASPRRIRQCGDLLHAEQEVRAEIVPTSDALDTVRACFPPGSVTGAPKVRAMQLIHELEDGPRGAYTGCIGSFFDNGAAHLSVAIRTATVHRGSATFHIGAGIVADSCPEREWQETLAKGTMLYRALHSTR